MEKGHALRVSLVYLFILRLSSKQKCNQQVSNCFNALLISISSIWWAKVVNIHRLVRLPHLNDDGCDDDVAKDEDESHRDERRRWHRVSRGGVVLLRPRPPRHASFCLGDAERRRRRSITSMNILKRPRMTYYVPHITNFDRIIASIFTTHILLYYLQPAVDVIPIGWLSEFFRRCWENRGRRDGN